jgi:hypothetical protein
LAENPKKVSRFVSPAGGYRAMVFHVGALIRLNEAGLLPKLTGSLAFRGVSITNAVLGLHWEELQQFPASVNNLIIQLEVSLAARCPALHTPLLGAHRPGAPRRLTLPFDGDLGR